MATVLIYPALALATTACGAAAYIWYQRPCVAVRMLIKLGFRRAGLTLRYVDLKGGETMCYAERGVASPTQPSMVFVHGFGASKDNWLSILQRLPRDIHVVAVDMIGHGDSSLTATDHAPSPQYLTDCMHEMLEKEGILEKPIHLVGTSMGGLIGLMYTAAYPQHVHMLSAICPAVHAPYVTDTVQKMRETKTNLLIPSTVEEMYGLLDLVLYNKEKIPRNTQMLKGFIQMKEGRSEFCTELFTMLANCINEEQSGELLSRVHRPVHVLWGINDELLHVSGAEFMRSKLSDGRRFDLIDKCGHAMTWDQPRRVTKALLEFRAAMLSTEESKKRD